MRLRTLIVLALAIVCGGSAATGVVMMQNKIPSGEQESVAIVVATGDISRGQVITESMVTTREWPGRLVPTSSAKQASTVVGRTVLAPIMKGEPVVLGRLADDETGSGIAALIPDGYRAYTIQTSRIASNVAGFVMPGHRVDVLLTLRGGQNDETGGGSSTTLLQAVEILAVNGLLHPPRENYVDPQAMDSVTLLVTPDQASLLDLGQNMGTLTMSLRNLDDIAESETKPATVNLLRYTQREPMFAGAGEEGSTGRKGSLANQLAALARGGPADLPPRIDAMRQPVSEVIPSPNDHEPLPEIEAIQTFRGRHSGRVLVRSDL